MTKQEFAQRCAEKIMILDGATGSNLQKGGMPFGVCPEAWAADNPEVLCKLQKDYVDAGSDIVYASTFTANRIKLKEYHLEENVEFLNKTLVQISKEAVGDQALVAGDLTMTGQQLQPIGTLALEELIDAYKEQIRALDEGGADLLVIETMMSLAEVRAALIAAKEVSELPVMVTMSFESNGRTLFGTNPLTALLVIQGLGADAIGVNCSAGPDKMISIIKEMQPYAKVPLIAKPNAGMPHVDEDGNTAYDMDAEVFAGYVPALIEAGAHILGGCCGTDPEYIRLTAEEAKNTFVSLLNAKEGLFLTTERVQTRLEGENTVLAFIDALENEELAEDFANGDFDTMYDLLDDAQDEEVDAIVVSVDETMEDATAFVVQLIHEASQYAPLPIVFKLQNAQVLEAALRNYPGIAGVMLSGEDEETCQKVAQKYGALCIKCPE